MIFNAYLTNALNAKLCVRVELPRFHNAEEVSDNDRRHTLRHCCCRRGQYLKFFFYLICSKSANEMLVFYVWSWYIGKTAGIYIRASPRANLFAISPCSRHAVRVGLRRLLLAKAREGDPPSSLMIYDSRIHTHL